MHRLAGVGHDSLIGSHWRTIFPRRSLVPVCPMRVVMRIEATCGCECYVASAGTEPEETTVLLELSSLGPLGELLQATTHNSKPTTHLVELRFSISHESASFGRLASPVRSRPWACTKLLLHNRPGERCSSVLQHLCGGCDGCPARDATGRSERQTKISHVPAGTTFLTAHPGTGSTTEMRMVILPDQLMNHLRGSRILEMATSCGLTPREHQILDQVITGATNEEIARAFEISIRTVKFHVSNTLRKIGARDRCDLLRMLH